VTRWIIRGLLVGALLVAAVAPPDARAFPVYSRKYATSCSTCHTVVPKLTHFGEAFRRAGYRFPGTVDSDYIKHELFPMGQDAAKKDFPNGMWPSFMTAVPLVGFGMSGRVTAHPDTKSYAGLVDNRTLVTMDRLATSGSMYASADIDDGITVLLSASLSDTSASIDQTLLVWSDLLGPKHAASLSVGYAFPTLSPYARTSSYAAGSALLSVAMTSVYKGSGAAFRVTSKNNIAELNGILGGRFEYGVGVANGLHVDTPRRAENYYGHLAYKIGGMRLDGEGGAVVSDTAKPWTENSFTVGAFAFQSNTIFTAAAPVTAANNPVFDRAFTYGGQARLQIGSTELNLGALLEDHAHVTKVLDGAGIPGQATQQAYSAELSYMVYQWLVTGIRAERITIKPRDLASATDTRILPVIGMQVRPNLKLAFTGMIEKADGQLTGGGDWSNLTGSGIYAYAKDPAGTTKATSWQFSNVVMSASLGF
jgi:hypothetical protein